MLALEGGQRLVRGRSLLLLLRLGLIVIVVDGVPSGELVNEGPELTRSTDDKVSVEKGPIDESVSDPAEGDEEGGRRSLEDGLGEEAADLVPELRGEGGVGRRRRRWRSDGRPDLTCCYCCCRAVFGGRAHRPLRWIFGEIRVDRWEMSTRTKVVVVVVVRDDAPTLLARRRSSSSSSSFAFEAVDRPRGLFPDRRQRIASLDESLSAYELMRARGES